MANRGTGLPSMRTNLDDWETDPDFIRDMDEIHQRWGTQRTVGSINMNELIDEVRKDHKIMREKFSHPSQRDHSDGFGGRFGIQRDRQDPSAHDYDYHEELSKHTSQEISRKIITSSRSSRGGAGGNAVSDAKRQFLEKTEETYQKPSPSSPQRNAARPFGGTNTASRSFNPTKLSSDDTPFIDQPTFEESTTKRFVKEEKSSSSSKGIDDIPPAFKSIQDKIDAFKKEFEDIESKVAKKSDLSKLVKKTTNIEKNTNVEYVSRSDSSNAGAYGRPTYGTKLTSEKSSFPKNEGAPNTSIKSLSQKFETLCREDSDSFRRRTDEKRKEFFDQIKNQVRETRKNLDGFDPIDEDRDVIGRTRMQKSPPSASFSPSPTIQSSSRDYMPKVYTKRETTQEEVISKVVKENDKIIENQTKRNVERTSSCHGSSDEDNAGQPTARKLVDDRFNSSPVRTESPISSLKTRRVETPSKEQDVKGAGLMARTLYDYQAAEEDELSFDVDDLITKIEKVDPGWYKGTIVYRDGRKKVGLFPANYVKLLNDTDEY